MTDPYRCGVCGEWFPVRCLARDHEQQHQQDGTGRVADTYNATAARLRTTEKPDGPAFTLGPVTTGHHCTTCGNDAKHAADVLRIDHNGPTAVAVMYWCPTCEHRA